MTPTPRLALLVFASLLLAQPAAAQSSSGPVRAVPPATRPAPAQPAAAALPLQADQLRPSVSDDDAERTREKLRTILRQYPPSVADVLRFDPSLLSNQSYLVTYPDLVAFLGQHPEIAHNPGFFVGQSRSEWDQNLAGRTQGMREISNMFAGLLIFAGIVTFMGLVGWVIRTLVHHRRWLRVSRTQTEVHAKVLDRLSSNEDLLAYIQTPAGQRLLESAPGPVDAAQPLSTPVGRILFSAQAGTIAGFVGVGLLFVSSRLSVNPSVSDVSPFLFTVGVVMIAMGAGFLTSSAIAYALSRRLGLLEGPTSSHA